MNLIDATVVKIIAPPIEAYGKWWVHVEYIAYGIVSDTKVMCNTKNEALHINVGYVFQT